MLNKEIGESAVNYVFAVFLINYEINVKENKFGLDYTYIIFEQDWTEASSNNPTYFRKKINEGYTEFDWKLSLAVIFSLLKLDDFVKIKIFLFFGCQIFEVWF